MSGTTSSPPAPGGDRPGALIRKRGRKRKVSDGAENKPEKLPPRQQTEKEKDILQYITDRDPTGEELDRIVKNLRDRRGRAYTRADYKRLQNLEPEINENMKDMCGQMKDMREDLKGMKDETKVMEAKLETVQKEKMNLLEALIQNLRMENNMYRVLLKAKTGISPQDFGIDFFGNIPHEGSMMKDPMNINMDNGILGNTQPQGGSMSQYPMNMGNQMHNMPAARANQHAGLRMGQTPITGGFGVTPSASASGMMQARPEFEMMHRQLQMPVGNQMDMNHMPAMRGNQVQGHGMVHKPSEDGIDWPLIDLQESQMNGALNNHMISGYGASTSTATHDNQGKVFQGY